MANWEDLESLTLQQRAKTYYQHAMKDQTEADAYWKQEHDVNDRINQTETFAEKLQQHVQDDETQRLQVLANLSIDEQRRDDLQYQLNHIGNGACDYALVSWACNLIGRTGDISLQTRVSNQKDELQKQVQDEYILIQQELDENDQLSRREFLETLIANALQGQAQKYNQTAMELLKVAEFYENRSNVEFQRAFRYNVTAKHLHDTAQGLFQTAQSELDDEHTELSKAEELLDHAQSLYQKALHESIWASLYAMTALGFFGRLVVQKFTTIVQSMAIGSVEKDLSSSTTTQTSTTLYRHISYGALHVLIFFISIGLSGDFVGQIDRYNWKQRTVIIAWFCSLAATIQTTILHTLPHCLATEWPYSWPDILHIWKHTAYRLFTLLPLFAMEFVMAWVLSGRTILSTRVAAFFGQWSVVIAVFGLLLWHVKVFEPRTTDVSDGYDTLSSVTGVTTTCPDDVSEFTPLTKTSITSAGSTAEVFVTMNLGSRTLHDDSSSSLRSLEPTSPYFVHVPTECSRLVFCFEILVCVCLLRVITGCLPLAFRCTQGVIVMVLFGVISFMMLFCQNGPATKLPFVLPPTQASPPLRPNNHQIEIVSI